MSDGPRHRQAAPDPARLTPPLPAEGITQSDNRGQGDLPELSQDPDHRFDTGEGA